MLQKEELLEAGAWGVAMLEAWQSRYISYSKGWKMIKSAEAQRGIQF